MQSNLEFVTDGSVVYRLGGNEWYAVTEGDDKVMLVDVDCEIGDKALKTRWSDGDFRSEEGEEGENGQAVLDYVNRLADTYFGAIKHAIIPRSVEAGSGKLENAYMWPMSKEEFEGNKAVGSKIAYNANNPKNLVWTRTFSGVSSFGYYCAWYVGNAKGDLGNYGSIAGVFNVAPAFYLRKSTIDHITDNGEIILKPMDTDITD